MIEVFKDICTIIVITEAFIMAGLLIIVAAGESAARKKKEDPLAFCAIMDSPCIYDIYGDECYGVCDDCPAARQHYETEGGRQGGKVRGIQVERRTD